jgi:hypothetical protein
MPIQSDPPKSDAEIGRSRKKEVSSGGVRFRTICRMIQGGFRDGDAGDCAETAPRARPG